jgi:hypothetical protein
MERGTEGRPDARQTILGTLIALAAFAMPVLTHAATLFVAPSSGQFDIGKTFSISLRVNSTGQAVNAIEGVLSFDPSQLQVVSVTSPGSIFNLNVQNPEYSNTAGTVRFTGVILNPGYTGASGSLITVTFRAAGQGTARVSYATAAVLANDGQGTNVLSGTSGGSYTIGSAAPTASPDAAPTPTPAAITAPTVTSPTHADPSKWYNGNDPQFQWTLPAGVETVSYLVNPKEDANPGNTPDGKLDSASFTDLPDGRSYFHLKFRKGGAWGPISHFGFNIDSEAPAAFVVERVDESDPAASRPKLVFSTTDALSGIAQYRMKLNDGEWVTVDPGTRERPSVLSELAPGMYAVVVEALDAAGNATQARLTLTVEASATPMPTGSPESFALSASFSRGWEVAIILFILLNLVMFFWWLWSRRTGPIIAAKRSRDRKVPSELAAMMEDFDGELAQLAKLGRSRPLYPEEKYLRSKLQGYRRTLMDHVREVENR